MGSISWGTLQPGETQEVNVYVRNEGDYAFDLALTTQNWQPENVHLWLSFSWSCGSTTIEPGQVVEVTQTLSVASDFSGASSGFSFSIAFVATPIVQTVQGASTLKAGTNVGIYWDQSCTQPINTITWGTLQPGGTDDIEMYVRNGGNDTFILKLATMDWQPEEAGVWLNFSWNCGSTTVGPGEVANLTMTLGVTSDFSGGFSGFSFSITLNGGSYLLGDINKYGVVDQRDLATLVAAYGSTPGDPNWNAAADLNSDGVVNLLDLLLLCRDWGKTSMG